MSVISKLQIVLEANTTAFDRNLSKVSDQLGKFSKSVQDMHAKMDKFGCKHKDTIEGLQNAGKVAGVGLLAIGAGIKATVDEAVKFESAMAGVKKVIDFETPEPVGWVSDSVTQHLWCNLLNLLGFRCSQPNLQALPVIIR